MSGRGRGFTGMQKVRGPTPQFKPQMIKGKNMSSRQYRKLAAKAGQQKPQQQKPPQQEMTREERIKRAGEGAAKQRGPGNTRTPDQRKKNAENAMLKAKSRANNTNPNLSGAMGAPAGAMGASAAAMGTPAGAMDSSGAMGGPAGVATGSAAPMGGPAGIEPLLGRIARALEKIVRQRGGKRLFTLRKRKTRGRGKTRGRR